jgi:hypothetical protein
MNCGCYFFLNYSVGQQDKLIEELKRADSVIVTYACDDIVSFERVSTHWLPQLQKLEVGDWLIGFHSFAAIFNMENYSRK